MSSGGHGGGGLPFLDKIDELFGAAHEQGIAVTAKPFILAGIMALIAFFFIAPLQTLANFGFLILTAPIWMPIILVRWAVYRFVEANRVEWLSKQEYVLLELKIPRDIKKSPMAMETVLTNLNVSQGESTWYKKYINGSVRPSWTFEIVSLGGTVHFYVRTRVSYRRPVESFFYAQYPGIEITEAIDYSLLVDPTHEPYGMWGCDYKKKKPDPIPIRTYAEYLDPGSPLPKPDETIDPLAQVIELLGSIGPKEQFWVQMNVRISGGEKYDRKKLDGKAYTWKDEAGELIEGIRAGAMRKQKKINQVSGALVEEEGFGPLTKGQQEDIYAIERNINKPAFDVGMRAIYLAPEDAFQGSMITFLINLWKPMSAEQGNGIGITRWLAIFNDYPWEDRSGHHKEHLKHQLVDAYRRRAYFHEPYKLGWMIMSSEELATIFHIPSASVTAPSMPRIQSSTSEAPSNLPTG
ncbi:MAG: hypothetical protein AAB582_03725 [Patescibacteria group bacterium]